MTQYQSNFNSYVAIKEQSGGLGSAESGSGATVLRITGGTPGEVTKGIIESKEIRRDAQRTRGRHGFRKTNAAYDLEASVGAADLIYQALLRGTWDTEISKAAADFTSITISSNVITLASGNPISMGFRVGDVIQITGSSVSANNGKNLRISALTTTTITVADTIADDGTPDTGATLVRRGRKVIMPAAGSLVNRYFTIEERDEDIDESMLFPDCFWSGGKWSMQGPDNLLTFTPFWVGTGAGTVETSPDSPVFSSPSTPVGVPFAVADATIRVGSSDLLDLTAFDLSIDNGAVAPATINPNKVSPTVMPGQHTMMMNLTVLRKDLQRVADFLSETSMSLHVLAVDNSAEPKNFLSLNVPFFTYGGVKPSQWSMQGGPKTETLSIPAGTIGQDTNGSGYDATMLSVQISNNS